MGLDLFLDELLSSHAVTSSAVIIVFDNAKVSMTNSTKNGQCSEPSNTIVHRQPKSVCRWSPCNSVALSQLPVDQRWTDDSSCMSRRESDSCITSSSSVGSCCVRVSPLRKGASSDPTLLLMPQRSESDRQIERNGGANAAWDRPIPEDSVPNELQIDDRRDARLDSVRALYDAQFGRGEGKADHPLTTIHSRTVPPRIPVRVPSLRNADDKDDDEHAVSIGQEPVVGTTTSPTTTTTSLSRCPNVGRLNSKSSCKSKSVKTSLRSALGALVPGGRRKETK